MTKKQYNLTLDWMRKIHQLEYAHTYESTYYSQIDTWFGISAFILTTVVAFSYRLPAMDAESYNNIPFLVRQNYFVPIASALAAILTGVVAFLKPAEKSANQKKAAITYEKLRHRIEQFLIADLPDEEAKKEMEIIKKEWDNVDTVNISDRNFYKGKKKTKSLNKYPEELSFLENIK